MSVSVFVLHHWNKFLLFTKLNLFPNLMDSFMSVLYFILSSQQDLAYALVGTVPPNIQYYQSIVGTMAV